MTYTPKQMLDMATHFWDPKHQIEVLLPNPANRKRWVVMVSDSECLTSNLDLVMVDSPKRAPDNASFSTIEKAFAVMEAYLLRKKDGE